MPSNVNDPTIAVIGAGATGLACAERLAGHGRKVVVFEKSRTHGGRVSTRRVDGVTFDHGAQYVRGRSTEFLALIRRLEQAGSACHWNPKARAGEAFDQEGVRVGAPFMRHFLAPLAENLDIRFDTQVDALRLEGGRWIVQSAAECMAFDRVISTVPAPQAKQLFGDSIGLALDAVEIAPCWALMVEFADSLPVGFDVWRNVSADIGWLARDSSKPGRASGERWVLHAAPGWSSANLERDREAVAADLLALFFDALEVGARVPDHVTAHRWRYAQTTRPLGKTFWEDGTGTALIGGDWCLGARVEFAVQSGWAMADRVLERAAT